MFDWLKRQLNRRTLTGTVAPPRWAGLLFVGVTFMCGGATIGLPVLDERDGLVAPPTVWLAPPTVLLAATNVPMATSSSGSRPEKWRQNYGKCRKKERVTQEDLKGKMEEDFAADYIRLIILTLIPRTIHRKP